MLSVHTVQDQLPQNARHSLLRSGSTVTGRVLSQNGALSYTVSIAGQKIIVKSESPLVPGETFSARVTVKDSLIELSLIKEGSLSANLIQKMSNTGILSQEVMNFLSSLGFEADAESLALFQFMQQIGMKIDIPAAKKAIAASGGKNGGVNREKTEISLLLDEKGLLSQDDAQVCAILGGRQGDSDESSSKKGKGRNQGGREDFLSSKNKNYPKISPSDIKAYFDSVDAASERKDGLLSAFNTVTASHKKDIPLRHWIVLPFEWDFQKSFGNIKLLFDSELKKLEKFIIDLKNTEKRNIFVVSYKDKRIDTVRFSSDQKVTEARRKLQIEQLASLLGAPVFFEPLESLLGFCAGDEEIAFVSGVV